MRVRPLPLVLLVTGAVASGHTQAAGHPLSGASDASQLAGRGGGGTPALVQLQQTLTAGDGTPGDNFGQSVAVDGDTAVVGAPRDRIGTNGTQGSAYVFVRTGATWSLQAKLVAGDGAAEDHFGTAVAIDGDTVVVGAPDVAVGGELGRGAVYVFTRSGVSWLAQPRLLAEGVGTLNRFGASVAIHADTLVAGAPQQALNRGSAYVFVRGSAGWTPQEKLLAADGADQHQFGASVGISGDTAAVGAYGAEQSRGAVYVFARSGTAWSLQQRLTASDRQPGDWLGWAVDVDGDTVVAGADKDSTGTTEDHGSAYVFVRQGTLWTEQQKLTPTDSGPFQGFGGSIALAGDSVVVGVRPETGLPTDRGAYLFARSSSLWMQQQRLASGTGTADGFAYAVDIDAGGLVVGAPFGGAGAAYVHAPSIPNPNTPPTITPVGTLEREQGAAPAPAVIATVADAEDGPGSLAVSATAPAGISVSGVANSDGTVSATIGAACAAVPGPATVDLHVVDSGAMGATAGLNVLVTANTVRPALACGPDLAVTAAAGDCSAPVAYVTPTATDDCPGATVACSPPPGSVFSGVAPVVCTATDAAGNTAGCSFSVTVSPNLQIAPESAHFPGGGGSRDVAVAAAAGCAWTAASNDAWITIFSVQAAGVSYEVAANPSPDPRTGSMIVAGRTFTVTQDGAPAPLANLGIAIARDGNAVTEGEPLTYTLTVINAGPATVPFAEIVNATPAGSFSSATATLGTVARTANGLRWHLDDLSASASATLTVIVREPGSGTVLSSASVAGGLPDPDPSDNTAAAFWIVNRRPPADLAITRMEARPSPVVVETPLTYTVEIANHGPHTAKDVVLITLLEPGERGDAGPLSGVTLVSTSALRGGTFSQTPEGDLRYDLAGLAAGESDTVTVVVVPRVVRRSPTGELTAMQNEAWLTTAPRLDPAADPGADPDADVSNNRAVVGTVVLPATGADLAVTRFAPDRSTIVGGSAVSFQVEAVNHGPEPATEVVLAFRRLPTLANVRVLSGAPSQGKCTATATDTLDCQVGTILAGGSFTVAVAVDTRAPRDTYDLVGTVDVFVAGRTIGLDTDPDRRNNTAESHVTVTRRTGHNLAVAGLTASPSVAAVGDPITYAIDVVNLGPDPADDVQLLTLVPSADPHGATAPSHLIFESAAASQGTCSDESVGLVCALGPLTPGAHATVSVMAASMAMGEVVNYVTLRSNGTGPDDDLNPLDNVRSVQTHVIAPPGVDLAVARFDDTRHPNGRVTYTIEVVNHGPTPAPGTVLDVRLPAGALRIRATASQGTVTTGLGAVTAALGGLLVGGRATLTVTFGTADPSRPLLGHAAVRCDLVELDAADNTALAITP